MFSKIVLPAVAAAATFTELPLIVIVDPWEKDGRTFHDVALRTPALGEVGYERVASFQGLLAQLFDWHRRHVLETS